MNPVAASRQRVLDTFAHRQPDRVPPDFGSPAVTGVQVSVVAALREHYGLERRPVKVHEPYQMFGLLEEDLKPAMGVDIEGGFRRKTLFGVANENWKPWNLNGLDVLVPGGFQTTVEPDGDTLIYPEGDCTAKPSGRMPKGFHFLDTIIPRGIRDVTEWCVSLSSRRAHVHAVYERQTEIALANLARVHARIGDAVDAVFLCGTDFGTQTSSFCSVQTFRERWLPGYKRLCDWIHGHTTGPLKEKYGRHLVFCGGGVDTQRTLPFGTPPQVRDEVLRRCEVFAAGGGFVFTSIHNIQAGTPVANVAAMLAAWHEFNGRP